MTLNYYNTDDVKSLVQEFFHLSFDKEDVPFESKILPLGSTVLTFAYNKQKFSLNDIDIDLEGLIVTGQFYESYNFKVLNESHSVGLNLHPTALYKLTNKDIFSIKNQHLPLKEFSQKLYNKLNPIFIEYQHNYDLLFKKLKKALLEISFPHDPILDKIDGVIEYIDSRDGMLNTYELLNYVNFSQKTLETNFKKFVGLTPGKYIRMCRFLKLMRKYEREDVALKDLIYMYNYHDHSHFSKDFKHFMKQPLKDYFETDNLLLNKYLSK